MRYLPLESKYKNIIDKNEKWLIDKEEFINDPLDAYENKIYCKGAPLKTAVIWNKEYIKEDE